MQRTEVHVYTRLASLELPQHTYTQYSLATEQLDQLLVAGLSAELDHILDVSPSGSGQGSLWLSAGHHPGLAKMSAPWPQQIR